MLMPKRTKYRRPHRLSYEGKSKGGREVVFGDYGQADTYMVIRDFEDYVRTHEQIMRDYQDRETWIAKQIMNTAMSGFFSSDRTINEYNDKIWHLTPIK